MPDRRYKRNNLESLKGEFFMRILSAKTMTLGICGVFLFSALSVTRPVVSAAGVSPTVSRAQETRSIAYESVAGKKNLSEKTDTFRAVLSDLSKEVVTDGRIALPLNGKARVVSLKPYEIRTPDFESFVDHGGKLVRIDAGPCRTYRGTVEGVPGSEARFYIDEDYFGGTITCPTESYSIDTFGMETTFRNGRSAKMGTVVISRGDGGECSTCQSGSQAIKSGPGAKMGGRAPVDPASFPGQPITNRVIAQKVIKVVTDCDFEYVQAHGGVTSTNARILSFVNTIDEFYQKGPGYRVRVTGQFARDTLPQIYTGTSTSALRQQVSNDWVNRATPDRAFVMMMSGKTFTPLTDGGTGTSGSCFTNDCFVAREADPGLFGQFATINLLSALFVDEMNLNLPINAGDPDCGSPSASFIGQSPVLGNTLRTEFCWKTIQAINEYINQPGTCYLATPQSTVTIMNSSSRLVPVTGGNVTFSIQAPSGGDWQSFSRDSWLTPQFDSGSGVLSVSATALGKGQTVSRAGDIVINGQKIRIIQQ